MLTLRNPQSEAAFAGTSSSRLSDGTPPPAGLAQQFGSKKNSKAQSATGATDAGQTQPKKKKKRIRKRYKDYEFDLQQKLDNAKALLNAEKAQNLALQDVGNVLEQINHHTAYLGALAARASLEFCALPSSTLFPSSVRQAISIVTECAWAGCTPPDEMLNVWSLVPVSYIKVAEDEFISKLRHSTTTWLTLTDLKDRQELEHCMTNAIHVRHQISNILSKRSPLALASFWKQFSPPPETHPEGLRVRKMCSEVLQQIGLSKEYKDVSIASLKLYKATMVEIQVAVHNAQMQIQQHLAASTSTTSSSTLPMQTQAHSLDSSLRAMEVIQNAPIRAVQAYEQLVLDVKRVTTWRIFAAVNMAMFPYVADLVQQCEVLDELERNNMLV